MGYNCLRKLQLDRDQKRYDINEELMEILEKQTNEEKSNLIGAANLGTLIHEFIEKALQSFEYKIGEKVFYLSSEEEIQFSINGLDFIGHYDLLLTHPVTGEKIVVDIKTINNSAALNFIPKKQHMDQLSLYQYHLGKITGYLLYITRDRGEVKLIRIEYDDKRLHNALKRLILVQKMENKKILLPTLSSPEDFPCNEYCSWKKFCWKTPDSMVKR